MLGPWIGALAKNQNKRIIFTPNINVLTSYSPDSKASDFEVSKFISRFNKFMPDQRYYSKNFGLMLNSNYEVVPA